MTLPPDKAAEIRASFAAQGLMRRLGASLDAVEEGRCVVSLPFSEDVAQQLGFFHGGIVGTLADVAGGYAAMSVMPPGTDVVTLEYKINFLRPGVGDRLVAEGTAIRSGRTVTVARVDVFAEAGEERRHCAATLQSVVAAPAPR